MKEIYAALVTLVLVFSPAVNAEGTSFKSGNQLYSYLQGDDYLEGVASGYIVAMADQLDFQRVTCIPSNSVTIGQLKDVTRRYLRDNPEVRHLSANILVGMALIQTWPCSR